MLMNFCLGLLKLSEIDCTLKAYLLKKIKSISRSPTKVVLLPQSSQKVEEPARKSIKDVIEEWLESESPYENE